MNSIQQEWLSCFNHNMKQHMSYWNIESIIFNIFNGVNHNIFINLYFYWLIMMLKIVFKNPDGQPKPALANTYSTIISSSISEIKCSVHEKVSEFELQFNAPDTYFIKVTACCPEFQDIIEKKIGLMLS